MATEPGAALDAAASNAGALEAAVLDAGALTAGALDAGALTAGALAAGGDSVSHLGAQLRHARQAMGLSLRELARQLGVSASFVSQLENGKSQPSVATLYSLAQLLDVSIDRLFEAKDAGAPRQVGGPPTPDTGVRSSAPDGAAPTPDTGLRSSVGTAPVTDVRSKPARARRRTPAPMSAVEVPPAPISRTELGSPADAWPGEKSERMSLTGPGSRPRLVMDSGVIWEQLAHNTGRNIDFIEMIYPAGSSSTNDSRMLRHNGFEYGYLLAGELQVTYGFDVFMLRPGESLGLDSSVPHLFRNLGSTTARGVWFVIHRPA